MKDSGFVYYLGNDVEVYVSSRPRKLTIGHGEGEYDADAYLSVTDTWCVPPKEVPYVWFPWNESRKPLAEMFYACNRALNFWIERVDTISKIQLFCDAGTHRSVTVFGAYLMTHYPDTYQRIVSSRVPIGFTEEKENVDEWSNPINYIKKYLHEFPEDMLLFKAMGEDTMSRLDTLCISIANKVVERFGSQI